MARQQWLSAVVVLLAFLVPLVAARPGGRLCHTSFFFPDPTNARTVTLPGYYKAGPAAFKLFSFDNNGFFGAPSNLVEVRLFNLHRQMLFNPTFTHSLDLRIPPEKPIFDTAARHQIVQTWSFSTSNTHHPITWVGIRSRRALWRPQPDLADSHVEQKPLSLDDNTSVWVFGIAVVLVLVCFMAAGVLLRDILQNFSVRSSEDHDVGFLYGYQELPSSEESGKEVAQKEFEKENAAKVEKV